MVRMIRKLPWLNSNCSWMSASVPPGTVQSASELSELFLRPHIRSQQLDRHGCLRTHRGCGRCPELLVSRCKHHYVFQLVRNKKCPLMLAVLHENMDLIGRIHERLE